MAHSNVPTGVFGGTPEIGEEFASVRFSDGTHASLGYDGLEHAVTTDTGSSYLDAIELAGLPVPQDECERRPDCNEGEAATAPSGRAETTASTTPPDETTQEKSSDSNVGPWALGGLFVVAVGLALSGRRPPREHHLDARQ
jgi:hypothetical protein